MLTSIDKARVMMPGILAAAADLATGPGGGAMGAMAGSALALGLPLIEQGLTAKLDTMTAEELDQFLGQMAAYVAGMRSDDAEPLTLAPLELDPTGELV